MKTLWRHLVKEGMDAMGADASCIAATTAESASQRCGDGIYSSGSGKGGVNASNEWARRVGQSGGGKISSRHLRRRTGSHKRRRRHRYPRGDYFGSNQNDQDEKESSVDERQSNEGNEGELSTIADNGNNANEQGLRTDPGQKKLKPKCRRARRKPALLQQSHSLWWNTQQISFREQAQQQGVSTSKDESDTDSMNVQPTSISQNNTDTIPHHWIPTHRWHAKRFHMSPPLFSSWNIPLIHTNRGTRAALRLATSESAPKCTVQDASWENDGCAVVLEFTMEDSRLENSDDGDNKSDSRKRLISVLQLLCGADADLLKDETVLSGLSVGEGLIYEVGAYPLKPVGPATFLFRRWSTTCDDSEIISNPRVCIMTHPSIRLEVISLVELALRRMQESEFNLSTIPLSVLRVRGRASDTTLGKALSIDMNEVITESSDFEGSHRTILEVNQNQCNLITCSQPKAISTAPNIGKTNASILLKSHRPNPLHNRKNIQHNVASSGWDIFCHPCLASQIFQILVMEGGACAIGLAEQSRAELEACPPLPIFPRDYPDTEQGRKYWEGGRDGGNDWLVIRECIEGAWGRMNTPLKRVVRHHQNLKERSKDGQDVTNNKRCKNEKASQRGEFEYDDDGPKKIPDTNKPITIGDASLGKSSKLINWRKLVTSESGDILQSVLVVRGAFGVPFLQLLHGCGHLPARNASDDSTSERVRRRRPRRRVRSPSSFIRAPPLSKKDCLVHSQLCNEMKASLSLPALLRCEIHCEGKGTLEAGDFIFPMSSHTGILSSDENMTIIHQCLPLGIVAAGGFSPSRGHCHGVCFVGAARFMEAINGTIHGMGVPTSRKLIMGLRVVVCGIAKGPRHGCITLLL